MTPLPVAAEVTRLFFLPSPRTSLLTSAATFLAFALAAVAQEKSAAPKTLPDLANNPAPAVAAINAALPTIFIAGDSTAARGAGARQQGWAVPFADYFDPAKVNIVNRARGGRSSRTFITEGSWDRLLADLKKDDIVLMQFGHNDGGALNDEPPPPLRARGSIPGLGEETKEIDNVLTRKHEVVRTFGWYMRKMVADAKAKGATPIVLSLTLRNRWEDGKIERGSGRYGQWSFDVAKDAAVPFIDLTNRMADEFDKLGEEKVKALYPQDHTHFNAEGADLHAAMVVAGLKGLRLAPLAEFLSEKGKAVTPERFAWLRLPSAANPKLPSVFLVGDSTVRTGRGDGGLGQWGWGEYLPAHLDLAKVNVVNRAVGGTGVRSFLDTGYWDLVVAKLKPGDVVMIQFGHNDNGARAPLKGIGEEVEERENPTTKQKSPMHTWGWYLRRYLNDARAKGATPVVCSLIPRKTWKDGKIARTSDSHADWARAVAKAEGVAFVDLHEIIARRYDELGPEKVNAFFADERVHTSAAGAELNAACVVSGLKSLPQNPVAAYLKPGA
ncbi:MAG: rhamnogalacturonan acetylesterase [Verrucomicrobia bacterium]|nr:rhamnogalacturonan acetylesterase [Verrucomicrobiota bacterium]